MNSIAFKMSEYVAAYHPIEYLPFHQLRIN